MSMDVCWGIVLVGEGENVRLDNLCCGYKTADTTNKNEDVYRVMMR